MAKSGLSSKLWRYVFSITWNRPDSFDLDLRGIPQDKQADVIKALEKVLD